MLMVDVMLQDVILEEIRKIRGLLEEPSTREVGVMCELLPSPATTRHTSSLGLDHSARRYHSILSRPLSPEPSPLRRKTKRQLLAHSKMHAADKRHLLKGFTERVAKKRSQSQALRGVECTIEAKSQKTLFSRHNYQSSLEEDSHINKTPYSAKTEVSGGQTRPVSGQSHAEIKCVDESEECDNKSDSKHVDSSKENSLGCIDSPEALQGDGARTENLVHAGLGKDNSLEGTENDFLSVNKTGDRAEGTEGEMLKVEPACGTESASRSAKGFQDTQPSALAKFKFSCKICSYKSMRENHFLKHMQLHDKVSFMGNASFTSLHHIMWHILLFTQSFNLCICFLVWGHSGWVSQIA